MRSKAQRQAKTAQKGSKKATGAPAFPPSSRRDRKRAQIVAAAKEIFFKEGYAGASMDQITARAGISKATLYAHFSSKEALLLEVVDDVLEPIRTAMGDLPRDDDLDRWLVQVGCMASRLLMSPDIIALQRLAIAEATRFPEIARAFDKSDAEAAFNVVMPVIEAAITEGKLKTGKPEIALSHFFEMCFGKRLRDVLLGLAKVPNNDEIEGSVRRAVDAFMDGWRAPQRSPRRRPSRSLQA